MKKIAVMSDIHGNSAALQAVLEDIDTLEGIERIFLLGDLVAFGPTPKQTLSMIRREPRFSVVLGDTDQYVIAGARRSTGIKVEQTKLQQGIEWSARRLTPVDIVYLESLPVFQVMQIGQGHLLAVHGSLENSEAPFAIPANSPLSSRMSPDFRPVVLLRGHTHIPEDRMINELRVVNTGSTGLPFDGDPRAGYAILSYSDSGYIQVEFRRVYYNVEPVIAQLHALESPVADICAYNLRTGRQVGKDLIYNLKEGEQQPRIQQNW